MILDALLSKELPDGTLDPEELAIRTERKLFEVGVCAIFLMATLYGTRRHVFDIKQEKIQLYIIKM